MAIEKFLKNNNGVRTESSFKIDDAAKANDKIIVYKTASGNHEYEEKPAGSGISEELAIAYSIAL